nr:ParA family protein [uncultured Pseudodesulfovibrio sp.]
MMTRIISIINQKGGVGKTTIALNMAHGFVREGKKVLAVDNDPQGNLTNSLLINEEIRCFSASLYNGKVNKLQSVNGHMGIMAGDSKLEIVQYNEQSPLRFSSVLTKIKQKHIFDYILIDSSPQITNLTFASIMAADNLLFPLQPSKFGLDGLKKVLMAVAKMKSTGATKAAVLGVVMNLVNRTKLHRQTILALKKRYPRDVMDCVIHRRTAYEESPIKGQSIWEYGKDERAQIEMSAFMREILKRLED